MIELEKLSTKWNELDGLPKVHQHILKIEILREAYFALHKYHSEHPSKNKDLKLEEVLKMEENILR